MILPASFAMFMQPDTIIGDSYNPQDLNHYSFERGNPYKYIDPTGRLVTSYRTTAVREVHYNRVGNKMIKTEGEIIAQKITYTTKEKGTRTVAIGINAYSKMSDTANRLSQTAYSSLSLGRNMYQEYMVGMIESGYEPRGIAQRMAQNKVFQLGATVLGGIAGNIMGGAAVGGAFAAADLQQNKALEGDVGLGKILMAYADTGISGVGGNILKGTANSIVKAVGEKTVNSIIIDVSADVGADVIYESIKQDIPVGE